MHRMRSLHLWIDNGELVRVLLTVLINTLVTHHHNSRGVGVLGHTAPLIVDSLSSSSAAKMMNALPVVPPTTFMQQQQHFYQQQLLHTNIIRQIGLPAAQGTEFEGPDPGLNAAIISAPEVCPNNYMRDAGGRCRPSFSYGPNPLSTFSPEKYKGSIQFYMGLQIGRPSPFNRRGNALRLRNGGAGRFGRNGGAGRFGGLGRRGGRLHMPQRASSTSLPPPPHLSPELSTTTSIPPTTAAAAARGLPLISMLGGPLQPMHLPHAAVPPQAHTDHNIHSSSEVAPVILPTPPPLTGPVAEITAILTALKNDQQSNADAQHIDDDDD